MCVPTKPLLIAEETQHSYGAQLAKKNSCVNADLSLSYLR